MAGLIVSNIPRNALTRPAMYDARPVITPAGKEYAIVSTAAVFNDLQHLLTDMKEIHHKADIPIYKLISTSAAV